MIIKKYKYKKKNFDNKKLINGCLVDCKIDGNRCVITEFYKISYSVSFGQRFAYRTTPEGIRIEDEYKMGVYFWLPQVSEMLTKKRK